jgi:hypothetical protein
VEEVTLPMLPEGAKPVVEGRTSTGTLYTVPTGYRLHLTHAWAAAGASVAVSVVEREIDAGPHTVVNSAGLSGLDLWIPAGETVTCVGVAGFVGWLSPPIP